MKHLLTTITILTFITTTFAQIENYDFNKHEQNDVSKSEGIITILDSTIHFHSTSGIERNKVLTRDNNGNITSSISHTFNDTNQTWINNSIITTTYFSTGEILKQIERPWNSDTQEWADTCSYLEYDINGNLIFEYKRYWNSYYNKFGIGEKHNNTYNNDGNITFFIEYKWNLDSVKWVRETQEIFTYENENLIQHIRQGWDYISGEWQNMGQYTYSYDAFGNRIQFTRMLWNNETSDWKNHIQYLYTYNNNNTKIEDLWQYWNDDIEEWYYSLKKTYVYDANNNIISEYIKQWNFETEEWDNHGLTSYTFDESGNQTLMLNQSWNKGLESWVGVYNHITEYDENGNKTLKRNQLWDDFEGVWDNTSQEIFEYDENDNLTQHIKQNWNRSDNNWENFSQDFYIYDENNNITQHIDYYWNNDNAEWNIQDKYDYFWSEYNTTEILDINSTDFKLYPNPATNKMTILTNNKTPIYNFNIFSISGKFIKSGILNMNNEVNITNLKSGIYFINIQYDEIKTSLKFIKK